MTAKRVSYGSYEFMTSEFLARTICRMKRVFDVGRGGGFAVHERQRYLLKIRK